MESGIVFLVLPEATKGRAGRLRWVADLKELKKRLRLQAWMKNVFMMVWMVCREDLHGPSAGSVHQAIGILPCHLYSGESHDEGMISLRKASLLAGGINHLKELRKKAAEGSEGLFMPLDVDEELSIRVQLAWHSRGSFASAKSCVGDGRVLDTTVAYGGTRSDGFDAGMLFVCGLKQIDGIDLDSFGWDSMFGLNYGVQTGTMRRLGLSLAQIGVDEWERQIGIAELMGSILDVKVKNTFLTNSCKEGHSDDTGVNQFLAGSIQHAANPYSINFLPRRISH
ncbi:hypothetical protein POTOM_059502 [Populus tomentosa]|uniref:Uncharacterized protein n=1 Tax=Populus tomentosa TaxID=118781 RepID=A0A8X7XUB4_POPTO|nr:hypothetical protein POTOM_059502 [Populus tomentosa]